MRTLLVMRFPILSATFLAVLSCPAAFAQTDRCADSGDLRLINGRIHTMNPQDTVVTEATIQGGRFTSVGAATANPDPCTRTIDLQGRTAVPGLIDNHNHIVLLGLRPGYDTRLETAGSIAEVQAAIRARASGVPAGGFITAMGGWNQVQFAEKRLPTLAELDAAAPNHPVIVYQAFTGPAATNTLGRRFFADKGVAVSETGAIAANAPSVAALNALRSVQTMADKLRGTRDALNYAASVGLTTNVDMGAFIPPGQENIQDSFTFDGLATANPFTMYDPLVALRRSGSLPTRVRLFFLSMDTRPDVPMLSDRLRNAFGGFGDDLLRVSGIGEFASNWPLFGQVTAPPNYEAALQLTAKQGWAFQQHSLSLAEDQLTAATFEKVNAVTPIADLRWSVAHVPRINLETINRFKALGAAIAVHPFEYLAGGPNAGPPLRTILDSGIRVGAGSDSAQISTLNPWLILYYMVTGKNSSGVLINAGQQLTRTEALRMYTSANGWFLREESTLGSIEAGKLGDVVVLSEDYFSTTAVPDEKIRSLKPAMTIVGGKVVYQR
ncbi:MAG: amidohydrolase family protein [Acidobacteriota bacterium]